MISSLLQILFNSVNMAILKESKKNKRSLISIGLGVLVITVALVLYFLGYFGSNAGARPATACITPPGFLCQSPVYSNSTGNIVVTLGQDTGTSWLTSNFVFVPQGAVSSQRNSSMYFTLNQANITYGGKAGNGLTTGQYVKIILPVSGAVKISTPATGTIWVQYTTSQNNTFQYAEIASINIKAS